jgi:hypothetical protein
MLEFHISRKARDFYQFDQSLFATTGNVIFSNFQAARTFAQKINNRRDLLHYPEQAVHAGQINGMGLIDEIMHVVIKRYQQQITPKLLENALEWVNTQLSVESVESTLTQFAKEFPPTEVYKRKIKLEKYIQGSFTTDSGEEKSNRLLILEELLVLWLANVNPAFSPYL